MHLNNKEHMKRLKKEFSDTVEKYSDRIYSIIVRMIDNRDDIMDIMQNTFLKTYRNLDRFREESSLYTYMVSVAINETRQHIRKRSKDIFVDVNEDILTDYSHPSVEETVIRAMNRDMLNSALQELPHKYREAIILKDIEGMSMKDISTVLNISIGAVKTHLHRGRLLLKELMENKIELM